MSDSPASAKLPLPLGEGRGEGSATGEAELLARAKAGDSSALDQIIVTHQEKIARLVQRLLGWPSDVEDVVQDVFVAALRNLPKFDGRSTVVTWLTRIAINRCRSHQRKQWLCQCLPFSRDAQAAVAEREGISTDLPSSVEHQIITTETIQQVHTAIQKLNQRDREIIVLRYLEEQPIDEIAKMLKASRNAVDVRLARARKRLEKLLKPNF